MAQITYRWSKMPEQREWMLAHSGGRPIDDVRRDFEERFGTPIGKSQVSLFRAEYGLQSRHGNRTAHRKNHVPVGTERPIKGYTMVKVAEFPERPQTKDNWRLKHVLVWERTRGLNLPPDMVVMFCDRDRENFDPANLKAVPRKLMGILNGGAGWRDRATLETAIAVAELKHGMADVLHKPTVCVCCGKTFTPDVRSSIGRANGRPQITCRECLDAGRTSYGKRFYGMCACEQCGTVFVKRGSSARFCETCRPRKSQRRKQ